MNRKSNYLKFSLLLIISMAGLFSSCEKEKDSKPLEIGDFHEGGVIFYLDGNGGGLVCAIENQVSSGSTIQWYYDGYGYTDATGEAVGTGKSNTAEIIETQGNGHYAAKVCDDLVLNGYDDWFLPSIGELEEMWSNRVKINETCVAEGGERFWGGIWWSSTEYNGYYAYRTNLSTSFWSGGISDKSGISDQFGSFWVRAVREF